MDVRTLIRVTHIDTTGYNCLRELEWPCIDTLGFPPRSGPAHVVVRPLGRLCEIEVDLLLVSEVADVCPALVATYVVRRQ